MQSELGSNYFVQDDTPNVESQIHARFYFRPLAANPGATPTIPRTPTATPTRTPSPTNTPIPQNSATVNIYVGYTGTAAVFKVQAFKADNLPPQVRIAVNEGGNWVYSAWYEIESDWNGIEISYYAPVTQEVGISETGETGQMELRVNGKLKETLSNIANLGNTIDMVRLGSLSGLSNSFGTMDFDSYKSRRFSVIGLQPDPGANVLDWLDEQELYL